MPDTTPQARAKIRELLETARRDVAATVASEEWTPQQMSRLQNEIAFHLSTFREGARVELKKVMNTQFAEGQRAADELISAKMDIGSFPAISEQALVAMTNDLATKITDLTTDATKSIQREIALGLVGGRTPFETMEAVGRSLDSSSIFGTIDKRANAIIKEEFGRSLRKGAQLRMEQAERLVIGLQKQWLHAGHPRVPRPTHLALHGKIINVNEKFDVLNQRTGQVEQALHPKDPALSAENSIGCECQSVPWKAKWNLTTPELGSLT